MDTYLMTWNPDNWKWTELANDAAQTMKGVAVTEPWSCGNTKRIKTGDRLFLLKQGKEPKGIIASGRATSDVYADEHWDKTKAAQGKEALYVAAAAAHERVEQNPLWREQIATPPIRQFVGCGGGMCERSVVAAMRDRNQLLIYHGEEPTRDQRIKMALEVLEEPNRGAVGQRWEEHRRRRLRERDS